MKKPFKVLAMHDMCGYGRSSLTAVQTILPSLNVMVCPLPTALLSNHFGFSELPSVLNLSSELRKFLPIWSKMNLTFDAFYSGYLASPDQVEIAKDYIKTFSPKFIFVDPVLGDNSKLYHGFDEEQVEAMLELIKHANMISPNLTEAAFLLKRAVKESVNPDEAKDILLALSAFGPQKVAITGSPSSDGKTITTYAYDKIKNEFYSITCPRVDLNLHGTGDSFASVLVGFTLQGFGFDVALKRAMSYLSKCANLALELNEELCLEPALKNLVNGEESCEFKIM